MVADLGGSGRHLISTSDAADLALAQHWSRAGLRVPLCSGAGGQALAPCASRFRPALGEWLPLHRLFRAWHGHRNEPGQDRRVVSPPSLRVWLALSYVGTGNLLGAVAAFP